jgi:hypothetical protein
VREPFPRQWVPSGVALPEEGVTDAEARAAMIRGTGGTCRLLPRLLPQIARLMEINAVHTITRHLVEAARESLVIGRAFRMGFRHIICKKYRHVICKVTVQVQVQKHWWVSILA